MKRGEEEKEREAEERENKETEKVAKKKSYKTEMGQKEKRGGCANEKGGEK